MIANTQKVKINVFFDSVNFTDMINEKVIRIADCWKTFTKIRRSETGTEKTAYIIKNKHAH